MRYSFVKASPCPKCGEKRVRFRVGGKIRDGHCRCTLGDEEWERRAAEEAKKSEQEEQKRQQDELSAKRAAKIAKVAEYCWDQSGRVCDRHPEDFLDFCPACPGVLKKTSKKSRLEPRYR